MPRTLAIGDIHGHLEALLALEDLVPFRAEDRLIFLGDYVDRGPHSKGVLDWLIERQSQGNVITLLGNHDLMMRDAPSDDTVLDSWVVFGGDKTLLSYRQSENKAVQFSDIPGEHWEFLRSCELWHETDSHIFVHACVHPAKPMSEQSETTMLWEKLIDPAALLRQDRHRRPHGSEIRLAIRRRSHDLHRHVDLRRRLADVP